jgi:hypothetical protein
MKKSQLLKIVEAYLGGLANPMKLSLTDRAEAIRVLRVVIERLDNYPGKQSREAAESVQESGTEDTPF